MNLTKWFDIVFGIGLLAWVVFAWIMPALFNADNDVTLGMVFLTFILAIYGVGRVIVKFISKGTEDVLKK